MNNINKIHIVSRMIINMLSNLRSAKKADEEMHLAAIAEKAKALVRFLEEEIH